jgi:hypothetical protein
LVPDRREDLPMIHRVAAKARGSLLLVGSIVGGLEVAGVDLFESLQTLRLRNFGLPKIIFGEDHP